MIKIAEDAGRLQYNKLDNFCLFRLTQVERDRATLIQQTIRQLNTQFGRRGPRSRPMTIHRVKVTFKDEPGEGSGVARSFYTAVGEAFLSGEKLPPLDTNRSKVVSFFFFFFVFFICSTFKMCSQ